MFKGITDELGKQGRLLTGFIGRMLGQTSEKAEMPPGTLTYIGEKQVEKPVISLVDYSADNYEEKTFETIEECFDYKQKPSITWINVNGVHETDIIEKLGGYFGIHPLVLEDIVHTNQRPKIEDYDNYLYFVLKVLYFDEESKTTQDHQLSLILGKGFILSFQERGRDIFTGIKSRIKNSRWRQKQLRADYLAYALIDTIVDQYFVLLDKLGENIEGLEDELNDKPTPKTLEHIYHLKRETIFLRKSIWPLREVVGRLFKTEEEFITESTRIYFKDVYDHTIQVIETVESFREMLSSMIDLYLSVISNRMNEVMKVLTIIATIFIPATFVAGIYGMNFEFMPELKWPWGYAYVWGVILLIMLGMIFFFKRKKWL